MRLGESLKCLQTHGACKALNTHKRGGGAGRGERHRERAGEVGIVGREGGGRAAVYIKESGIAC